MAKVTRELVILSQEYSLQDLSDGDLMEDIWDSVNSLDLGEGKYKVEIIYQEEDGE